MPAERTVVSVGLPGSGDQQCRVQCIALRAVSTLAPAHALLLFRSGLFHELEGAGH